MRERDEMLSLTDMWKAARRPDEKRSADWLSQVATKEIVGYIRATLDAGVSGIQSSRDGRGVDGSTWAHGQIAFA
ncbi:KilA-N domain-containing protein [Methylobacterium sp. Leaf117]|uniref:KilA-N domain-containing protein n=1 Tax=Methylobacterium sp. Leaf117 TaxID=1736260 RepID=UPI00244EDCB1|nr:KilA-N domain-containing protein [Methylobacterium sp. Leaf117]